MPQLVKLQNDLRDTGFVIIGNHVQSGDEKKVAAMAKSLKLNFPVFSFSRIDIENKRNGIPRNFLFDSKGNLVEAGHVSIKNVRALVDREPHFLAAGREYQELGRLAAALKKTRGYGPILRKLEREEEEEGLAGEEAKYLISRIRGYGKKLLERAKRYETEDAFAAMETYSEVATKWKGDQVGEQAAERMQELKKDEEFQDELTAATIAKKIRDELDKLVSKRGTTDLQFGPNPQVIRRAVALFQALRKKLPDARATAAIQEELEELGVGGP